MALGCFVSQSLLNVAFIVALLCLVARLERSFSKFQRLPGIDGAILLYFIAFFVSAMMGVDSDVSFTYITELKRPLIAYVVASSINSRRDAWAVVAATVLGAWVTTTVEFKQYFFGGTVTIHNITRAYAPYELTTPSGLAATHNDLAQLAAQALGLVLVPLLFWANRLGWPQRIAALTSSAWLAVGILRTLSRASLVAALAGIAVVGAAVQPRRLLWVIVGLAILYPVMPASLTIRHENFFGSGNYSNWFRLRMVEVSLQIAREHMPFGIGRHNFLKVHERMKRPEEEASPHAHNNFLQVLVDMGIPGIIWFTWFQLGVLVYLFRRTRSPAYEEPERMLLGGVLMAYLTFTVNGLFHFNLGDALPASLMFVLVGLGYGVGERLAIKPVPATDEPPSAASKELA